MKFVLLSGLKLQSKLKILKLYSAKCYYEITEPNTTLNITMPLNYPNLALKLQSKHESYHESLPPDLTAEGHGSSVMYGQKFLY